MNNMSNYVVYSLRREIMSNRLKLLMKIFRISNNDLALLLRVDVSLISKWRSGTRSMDSNPEYVRKLVAYIADLDKKNHYKNIRELLSKDYNTVTTCSEDELVLFLTDWLCSRKEDKAHDFVLEDMIKSKSLTRIDQMYYWEGTEGRRQAVEYFTQYANSFSPGAEIISYTNQSNQWFHEDPEFMQRWMKLIREFFAKGNIMKIVHPMNRNYYDIAASMGKWLPLHMTCEVKGYYLKKYDERDAVKVTMLVLTGKMVLFSISTDESDGSCKTWSVTDSVLTEEIERVAKKHLENSQPLFKRYSMESEEEEKVFLNAMLSLYEMDSNCYFYNDFNHMLPFGREKRRVLFAGSGMDEAKTEHLLTVLETIDSLKENCECYFIIDMEVLRQWIQKEVIKTNILSLFAGQPVYVPRHFYMDAVMGFLDHLLIHDNQHVCIVDKEAHEEMGNLCILSGGRNIHTFVSAYDTERTVALGISEYTVATALCQKLESIWMSTPYMMKNKEYVVDYIRKEIKEFYYQ